MILILVALVAVNALLGATVRGVRLDLTEGRIYSLSPGIGEMLRRLEEPIRIELYHTVEASQSIPGIRTYAARVREFLEELVAVSGGKLRLRLIDPLPFSEAEDAAKLAGIAALRIDGAGRELMLGLVAVNAVDRSETIPFLDPQNEPFLEYEVVRLVQSLGRTSSPRVGVLSTLSIDGGFDMASRQPTPPWQIVAQMRSLFDVVMIPPADPSLPDDLDALVLIHPKGLDESMLRAIDEYAFGGGRILAFVDAHCESQRSTDPTMPTLDRASDLGPLLEAWGVRLIPGAVIGDAEHAQRVQARVGGTVQVLDYVVWLSLGAESLDRDDPVTGSLGILNMASVGAFETIDEGGEAVVLPLILTSEQSMRIAPERIAFMPDPAALLREFVPAGRAETIGVRIDGRVSRAFPQDPELDGEVEPLAPGNATIVIIGDADMLQDEFWIRHEQIGGISLGSRTVADNGVLVLNALEMLTGDAAMLNLRGRAVIARPFERVERIRRAAEARYLDREQALQEEIRATEGRIADLQTESGQQQQLVLSPEQEAELDRLREEVLRARGELRQVQFDLRQDYELLGRRLLLINVVGWPLIVALFATLWSVNRAVRHRRGGAR